jgi:exodeoxyribonuclease-5
MSFSPQQEQAIKDVREWLDDPSQQVFYIAGYAGTGKTTIAKSLVEDVKGRVLFGAFTGKAALVLRKKGCFNASTIHSMIYRTDDTNQTWEPKFVLNPESAVRGAALVVIDECSMVNEDLGQDLLSFGTKVLVLGDPAQLPPVKGAGYFTSREPDVMLTEVHRQAQDNPIIELSMQVREGRRLRYGTYGNTRILTRSEINAGDILEADQVLVGMNKTRQLYNDRIRELKGFDPDHPVVGDKLICLKNDREKKLLNGGMWEVFAAPVFDGHIYEMLVTSEDHIEDKPTEVLVRNEFFEGREDTVPWEDRRGTDEFTYGYAITGHKSQGSQWDNIVIFDESRSFRKEAQRWLYTAITRAAERLTLVQ